MRIGLGELMIHGLSRDVFLPKERRQNELPLPGEFQLVLAQVFLQCVHLFCVLAGRHPIASSGGH
jgi:hypothetical protein